MNIIIILVMTLLGVVGNNSLALTLSTNPNSLALTLSTNPS